MAEWQQSTEPAARLRIRESAVANVDGCRLHAEVDEYGERWSVQGNLAGYRIVVLGGLPTGSTLDDARIAAENALPELRAAGMTPS